MWMYTHFSWMVMISIHYRHDWPLPSLYHCFSERKACEWSRQRSAPLLPFSWLAGAPASFVRKRLLSRHSRRSLEVRNFIPCLMKRDGELWLQPAGRGTVGRGVSVCSVEQVISGNKPAAWPPASISKTDPQTCPRETGLCKMHGAPRWEVVARQQNLVSTLFTIHTTVSRQLCSMSS